MRRLAVPMVLGVGLAAGVALANPYGLTPEEVAEIAADYGVDPAVLGVAGDMDYGAYLGGECTTCHQTSGDSNGIPAIIYLDELGFVLAMHEYKTKQRENSVMQMIAGRLGDEEIASLAAYFASLEED